MGHQRDAKDYRLKVIILIDRGRKGIEKLVPNIKSIFTISELERLGK
jgi:hypothetical protein